MKSDLREFEAWHHLLKLLSRQDSISVQMLSARLDDLFHRCNPDDYDLTFSKATHKRLLAKEVSNMVVHSVCIEGA